MNRFYAFTVFLGLFFLRPMHVDAQNISKELSESPHKVYTSIEQAMQAPDSVRYLSLRHQKLKQLPAEIFTFTNLEILDLSKNKLTELPAEIEKFSQLREINVSNNKLTSLPIQLGNLTRLEKILAYQNNIAILPTTIGNLVNLELLDLWSNEIETFPEEISELKKLRHVDLRGIMMTDEQKATIRSLLPKTEIMFSAGCNCLK